MVLVLAFASGCGSPSGSAAPGASAAGGASGQAPAATGPAAASDAPTSSSAPASSADPASSAGTTDGGPTLGPIATSGPAIEGTVSYVRDDAAKQFVNLGETTGDVTLSVKDGGGRTWTLTIPEGAVPDGGPLVMSPLKEITASGLPGPIGGGIAIDADQAQFLAAGTLTVTGDDGREVAILTGAADGTVSLVPPAADSLSTVGVTHFSPWYWIDPQDIAWSPYAEKVMADGNAAIAEANTLLASPLTVPAAPSVAYGCKDEKSDAAVTKAGDAFTEALRSPEVPLIRRLLEAERLRQLAHPGETSWHPSILQLSDRLVRKDLAVLKATKPKADVMWPVLRAVISTGRDAALIGSDTGPLMAALDSWSAALLTSVVNGIAKDHDFKQYADILQVLKAATLLGSNAPGLTDFIARLRKAIRFDARVTWDWTNADGEHWLLEGTIPMQWTAPINGKGFPFAQGSATISEVAFSNGVQGITLSWKPFTAQATVLDVDVCKGTGWVGVDQFYLDTESYMDSDGTVIKIPRTWMGWEWVDLEYNTSFGSDAASATSFYGTKATLANGSKTWIDETVTKDEGGWHSSFRFEVIHTGS